MGNKNTVKDWYQFDRDIVETVVISLKEDERQLEVALFNLRQRMAKGETERISHPKADTYHGVPVKHLTKSKIGLRISRAKNRKRYDEQAKIIEKGAKADGFKYFKTCRTVNVEGQGCDVKPKWWNKK